VLSSPELNSPSPALPSRGKPLRAAAVLLGFAQVPLCEQADRAAGYQCAMPSESAHRPVVELHFFTRKYINFNQKLTNYKVGLKRYNS
jgi:hypothetical protein